MVNIKMYAIFGNPIKHSKSPYIHAIFADQLKINYAYGKVLSSKSNFSDKLNLFFKNGGQGANITSPFKEEAYKLANILTKRAIISKSVNTLKRLHNGQLLGDNTDGIGLINDLKRLSYIEPNYNILLIGAGGAARGVIFQLLSMGCKITITNRTFTKAKKISNLFKKTGEIQAIQMNELLNYNFSLIINATSSGDNGEIPNINSSLINPDVKCYDMSYQNHKTPFLNWCERNGAKYMTNGLGMLIEQAAYSVKLWHGELPSVNQILNKIKKHNNFVIF